MEIPRATSGAPVTTGAQNSLAGEGVPDTKTVPHSQRRYRLAQHLDRAADWLLATDQYSATERLAYRAADMREAVR